MNYFSSSTLWPDLILQYTFFGLAILLIFLLLRWLILWYWRIDENTENLRRVADALEKIASKEDKI